MEFHPDEFRLEAQPQTALATAIDDVCRFVDATKSFLDEKNISSLNLLASRLSPFRIDLKQRVDGDVSSIEPILVLENQQHTCDEDHASEALTLPLSEDSQRHHTESSMTDYSSDVCASQHDPLLESIMPDAASSDLFAVSGSGNDVGFFGPDAAFAQDAQLVRSQDVAAVGNSVGVGAMMQAFIPPSELIGEEYSGMQVMPSGAPDAPFPNIPEPGVQPGCQVSEFGALTGDTAVCLTNGDADQVQETMTPSDGMTCAASIAQPAIERVITSVMYMGRQDSASARSQRSDRSFGETAKHRHPSSTHRDVVPHETSLHPDEQASATRLAKRDEEASSGSLTEAAMFRVDAAARACVRPDYVPFLRENLPRWVQNGLWQDSCLSWQEKDHLGSYDNLQKVYSFVCHFDVRMRDDAIRSRIAMVLLHLEYENTHGKWRAGKLDAAKPVTSMGRGNTSSIIDMILEHAHPEWACANHRARTELRAKFHDRKRHGKRWWVLVNALGPSILFLTSSQFAGIVRNTTFTVAMMKALPQAIRALNTGSMAILDAVNPVAESLFHNHGFRSQDVDDVLERLQAA